MPIRSSSLAYTQTVGQNVQLSSTLQTKLEWSTQRATGHGEEGRTTPPGGRRLRSNPARAQLSLPPEKRVDPTLRLQCSVPRGRAARGCGAGRKQTDLEERRERGRPGVGGGERGPRSDPPSAGPQLPGPSDRGPGPAPSAALPRGRAHQRPGASGALSHKAVGCAPPTPQRPT